ncbi:MAG: class I SAM-dependent methyltransferase [Anaerolineaceae bacterium]|nr:class I SAM-dependent methyltransferase [Anaerolineaceae bacterium]
MEETNKFQTDSNHSLISPIRCSHPDAERWNGRYQSDGKYQQQGHPSQLLQDFAYLLPPGGVVLDAAAGVGLNALFAAQQGMKVVALDISEVGLRLLRQKAAELGVVVDTAVFDLITPYFPPNCVDVLLNFRFLERAAFPAYRQALRPGGLLFFETFVHTEAGDTPTYLLEPGELPQAFADFEIVHSVETAVRGPRSGKWRDIAQLIARKKGD